MSVFGNVYLFLFFPTKSIVPTGILSPSCMDADSEFGLANVELDNTYVLSQSR